MGELGNAGNHAPMSGSVAVVHPSARKRWAMTRYVAKWWQRCLQYYRLPQGTILSTRIHMIDTSSYWVYLVFATFAAIMVAVHVGHLGSVLFVWAACSTVIARPIVQCRRTRFAITSSDAFLIQGIVRITWQRVPIAVIRHVQVQPAKSSKLLALLGYQPFGQLVLRNEAKQTLLVSPGPLANIESVAQHLQGHIS